MKKIGKHILAHPNPPTWCVRCGEFSCYLRSVNGPTVCKPKPKGKRWWGKMRPPDGV